MRVSLRGKGRSAEAKLFKASALESLYDMKQQLIQHTYKLSSYNQFIITEPKRRIIMSGSFRDKVLQHCLCDYVLLPRMASEFILDNYAGQIGKGTLFGLNRLTEHLVEYYKEYGANGYILKCDISKFFYSINHDKLKEVVRLYFTDIDIQWVCDLLIDSVEGNGLPLGNQSSQVFALMYLMGLDDLITKQNGFKLYGRYMDDFYIIHNSREELKRLLAEIKTHLKELGLILNNKTEIVPIKKGIRFLGFHTYLTDDGQVIRKLTGEHKRGVRKKLLKYAKLVRRGRMTIKGFNEIYQSMRNHISHGNCYNLLCSLDKYVDGLLANQTILE